MENLFRSYMEAAESEIPIGSVEIVAEIGEDGRRRPQKDYTFEYRVDKDTYFTGRLEKGRTGSEVTEFEVDPDSGQDYEPDEYPQELEDAINDNADKIIRMKHRQKIVFKVGK